MYLQSYKNISSKRGIDNDQLHLRKIHRSKNVN